MDDRLSQVSAGHLNYKEADDKVAKGTMKYYTADEIRSKLEDILNEKI